MKTNTEEMSMWARKCVLRFDARSFLFWSNCLNDHYSSISLVNNWKDSMETKNLIKDSAPRTFNKHTLQNQSLWFLAVYLTSLYILFFLPAKFFRMVTIHIVRFSSLSFIDKTLLMKIWNTKKIQRVSWFFESRLRSSNTISIHFHSCSKWSNFIIFLLLFSDVMNKMNGKQSLTYLKLL